MKFCYLIVFVLVCSSAFSQDCHNGNCTEKQETTQVPTVLPTTPPTIFVTAPPSSSSSQSLESITSSSTAQPTTAAASAVVPLTVKETIGPPTIEPVTAKGRAINFTEETHQDNGLNGNGSSRGSDDLSDVSMDDDEEKNSSYTPGICVKGGLTYSNGEKIEDGCETVCTCMNGKMGCGDRCKMPYVRKGKAVKDPMCHEKPSDDSCCSLVVCTADTETEPLEMCTHQNKTYQRGERFNDECAQVCTCERGGKFSCKPRCRLINKTSDRCVEVPDPNDSCCKMILCDVTLDDHEHYDKEDIPKLKLISAKFVNASKILLKFDSKVDDSKMHLPQIELSSDRQNWKAFKISRGGFVDGAKSDLKYARLENTDDYVMVQNGDLVKSQDTKKEIKSCVHNGETHKLGEEFYDGCEKFCQCTDLGVKCLKMQCPTYFGLDVVDPSCVAWETEPPNFVPSPPNCCPEKVRCKNNGSCLYESEWYQNWQEIPTNVTGCDKRCYCEMGKVECQNACPPVTAAPPANLPCPKHLASLSHLPDDECCMAWICSDPDEPPPNFPAFPVPHGFPQSSPDDINVQQVQAIDGSTVRLIFSVSSLIVGLHGRVEVRYTNKHEDNLANWEVQVFAPPNDLIATPQLEFDLIGLQPNTDYKIKITIMLRDLHNTPTSRIYTVRTPATLPPMIHVDPNIVVIDANSTWANIGWRKLTEYEQQFVDGVQLRFKEISGKVYAATPLIHRAVTSYTLENLRPNTEYETGIYFIPFPGQTTELQADRMINFTTSQEYDPYGFNVTMEITHIKPTTVEISWSGVPYPEDKYVNIYRAIYQSDSGKGDTSTFKIAKRDSPTKTIIQDLKPGTRYRLWLEVYLTSGKIKTSNVQDFLTKPRSASSVGASTGKLSGEIPDHSGDYYGPLVVVAILAAIGIMSTLILLMILVKRHNQNKHTISNNTRVSQSAYDNPTYKVEIQQETMDL